MTEGDKDMLRRIFVACDTSPHSAPALLAATRLATELHAELDALFIEDVSLLRLAGLPFATEVDLHSGASRQLDTQVMERTMHYRAERVRQTLIRAAEIGEEAGLKYVYAGNIPGQTKNWEDTRCPGCQTTVIQRRGFRVLKNSLTAQGTCPNCQQKVPGIWG